MTKRKRNDSFGDELLKAVALIGGTWLGIEILKSLSKKEIVYDCPVCRYPVKFGTAVCPNCHSNLSWPTQAEVHGQL